MAKTRQQKEAIVAKLVEDMREAKSVVAVDYQGLGVAQLTDFRAQLRDAGARMHVLKNSLAARALQESGLEDAPEVPQGPMAYVFGFEDEVAPAKVSFEFAKKTKKLEFKGGWLGETKLSPEDLKALAQLPSKDELIAKTVGTIKAPLTGFVNVLAGNVRGLVTVLGAIRDQKQA